MVISTNELAFLLAEGLKQREEALALEQSPKGLDALSELEMHAMLETQCRSAGYGAWREQPFPSQVAIGRKKSTRHRCDLVLTPAGTTLIDPQRELDHAWQTRGTLFEHAEQSAAAPRRICQPEDASWIEIKVIAQISYVNGIPGPNRSYSSQLIRSMFDDLRKLGDEARILRGFVVLILFTAGSSVAEHDLGMALNEALKMGAKARSPCFEHFRITDRVGNDNCTVAVVPSLS